MTLGAGSPPAVEWQISCKNNKGKTKMAPKTSNAEFYAKYVKSHARLCDM